jgi:hypothetical protein
VLVVVVAAVAAAEMRCWFWSGQVVLGESSGNITRPIAWIVAQCVVCVVSTPDSECFLCW